MDVKKFILGLAALASISAFAAINERISDAKQKRIVHVEYRCAFGNNLAELDMDTRFEIIKKIDTLKASRSKDYPNAEGKIMLVTVSELKDKATGRIYHMNVTDSDEWSPNDLRGWIEDFTGVERKIKGAGAVVAEISDNYINCLRNIP